MAPSEVFKKGRVPQSNPFLTLKDKFISLDERFPRKELPEVIDEVASHMIKNDIPAATVTCKGNAGLFKKYFVNLRVLKKEHPEEFQNVTEIHSSIHLESPNVPNVFVLKSNSLK